MTKGDAGQNISTIAQNATEAATLTTSLPYVSYVDLAGLLDIIYQQSLLAINGFFVNADYKTATPVEFKEFCDNSAAYKDTFVCDGYRLCRAAKLLMSLGYGNFTNVIRYDIFAMAVDFVKVIVVGIWKRLRSLVLT